MTSSASAAARPDVTLGDAYSRLVVEVFRLNGTMLAVGNALGDELGLRSSRWQVLGAISLSSFPLPVAHIARNMGLTRQAVQRSVDELRGERMVRLVPNPHHRRAALVTMTAMGEAAYHGASSRHATWATRILEGIPPDRVDDATELLREIQRRVACAPLTDPFNEPEEKSRAEARRDGSSGYVE